MKKLLFLIVAAATVAMAVSPRIVAYYPYWVQYSQFYPKDVRFNQLTHLHYGYWVPSAEGELLLADASDQDNFAELARLSAEKGTKLVISIGGVGNDDAMQTIANERSAASVAAKALELISQYNLAGVEIDWKVDDASGVEEWNTLVNAFADAFASSSSKPLLVASVSVAQAGIYDADVLQKLDYITVMSLDEMSADEPSLRPNSDGRKLIDALASLENKGIAPEKLVPVIPLYGKTFMGATGFGSTHEGVGSGNEGFVTYNELMTKFNGTDYKVTFDSDTWSELAVSSREAIVFNGIPSVRAVVEAVKNKYGGVGVYDLSNDSPEPIVSLLVTIGQVLRPDVDYKKKHK